MNKLFALLAIIFFTAIAANAQNQTGPWNPDADGYKANFPIQHDNDYSFDYSTGEYKVFVICELTIQNYCGNLYLGWLNPDGARDLGNNYKMTFKVHGGNGWPFESNATFGGAGSDANTAFANDEQTGNPTKTVFITGSNWYYNGGNIGNQQFTNYHGTLSGSMNTFGTMYTPEGSYGSAADGYDIVKEISTTYNDNASIARRWTFEDPNCYFCVAEFSNACQGDGTFELIPGTVWAAPNAKEGFYTFPVYIDVDYLTFKNAADYWGNAGATYNDPGAYTYGPHTP